MDDICYEYGRYNFLSNGSFANIYEIGSGIVGKVLNEGLDDMLFLESAIQEDAYRGGVHTPRTYGVHNALDVESERLHPILVMDMVPGDNVAELYAKNGGVLDNIQFLCDKEVEKMDGLGFDHGDITDDNFIYDGRGNKVYLIDFGSCRCVTDEELAA